MSPGPSIRRTRPLQTERHNPEQWRRVGAFVRRRREELGLSQGDIVKRLGYSSANSVSNIEVGKESLPAKRAYAWADVLDVPRSAFYLFVMGEHKSMEDALTGVEDTRGERLTPRERELIECYRALPPSAQEKLRIYGSDLVAAVRSARARKS